MRHPQSDDEKKDPDRCERDEHANKENYPHKFWTLNCLASKKITGKGGALAGVRRVCRDFATAGAAFSSHGMRYCKRFNINRL